MERYPLVSTLSLALVLLTALGGTFARLSWLQLAQSTADARQANRATERERFLTQLQAVHERRLDDEPDWPRSQPRSPGGAGRRADGRGPIRPTIRTEIAAALTAPCFREVRRIDLDFQS